MFNTGMTGYQEIVTDLSYRGQMVTFTYPMISSYGVSGDNLESGGVRSKAIVVREAKNTSYSLSCPEPLGLATDFGPGRITHLNLNDGTVEGLKLDEISAFSAQYHPEAGPGPHDSTYLFGEFTQQMSAEHAGRRAAVGGSDQLVRRSGTGSA